MAERTEPFRVNGHQFYMTVFDELGDYQEIVDWNHDYVVSGPGLSNQAVITACKNHIEVHGDIRGF